MIFFTLNKRFIEDRGVCGHFPANVVGPLIPIEMIKKTTTDDLFGA